MTTPGTSARPSLRARWRALPRARRWAALAGAAVALYLACGFLVLPAVLRAVLPAQAGQALGRAVTLESVRFNPLTQTLTLDGLAVAEAQPPAAPNEADAADTADTANATAPTAPEAEAAAGATAPGTPPPFVSVRRIVVNASSFSLLRLTVLVDEVRLIGPRVHLAHLGQGEYNFSDIARRLAGDEQAREDAASVEPAGPFPLVVSNFVIEDGGLTFEDRPKGRTHTVEALELTVPFTSTLPRHSERDVEPLLRAVVNGTPVQATGRTRPFARSLRTEFSLVLRALDLTPYAPYAPLPPQVRLAGGSLTLDMCLVFERSGGVLPGLALEGHAQVDDLALTWTDGRELAGFETLAVDLERLSLDQGLLRLAQVRLTRPHAALVRGKDGALDWAGLLPAPAPAAPKPAPEAKPAAAPGAEPDRGAPQAAFVVELARLEVEEGRLAFTDHPGGQPLRKTVVPITLTVDNVSTAPEAALPASFSLSAGRAEAEQLVAAGTATLSPLAVNATLGLSGVALPAYAPYYAGLLPLRVLSGTARLGADCALVPAPDGATRLTLDNVSLGLARLALAAPGEQEPLFTLASLELTGGRVDPEARRATAKALTLGGGALSASRLESGAIDLAALFSGAQAAPAPAPAAAANPGPAWAASLDRLTLADWDLRFTDRALPAPAALRLRVAELTASGLGTALDRPVDYALDATLGGPDGGGALRVAGALEPADGAPGRATGTLELEAVPLAPFGPYLAAASPLSLERGTASASGRYTLGPLAGSGPLGLDLRLGGGLRGLNLGAGGAPLAALEALDLRGLTVRVADLAAPAPVAALDRLGLKGLALRDPSQPRDAATLAALTVHDARVDLPARSVAVAMVDVQAPELRLVVAPDGTLNLARIARRVQGEPGPPAAPSAPQAQAAASPAAPGAAAPEPEPAPFALALDTLAVDDGTVRFRDQSLSPAFSSTMEHLTLRLEGLSTAPGAPARLSAEATIDGHAALGLTGHTTPTAQGLNPALRLTVRGLDLTQFSPYALRAIAHPVSAGVLDADANLAVEGREVSASNLLRLIRFDLGQKQQVEGAMDAPVGLAVALLRDASGDIVLDIPIRGNLDDPQFQMGKVVFRAVMNLLLKAVTSPFALIGSVFGGSGGAPQDLETLVMDPGRTALSPETLAKLDTVAKALAERPGLGLEIAGVALPAELPTLAELRLRRTVRLARYNELKDQGQAPASVEATPLSAEEYEAALTEAYKNAPFDKPTTMLGFVADQPVPEMERMLREHLAPGPDDLPALAQRRARKVREALAERGVDPARMQLVGAPARAESAEPGVRLFLR